MNENLIVSYINAQDPALQPRLNLLYETLQKALPGATEKISWQMPTFWNQHNLIHFAAHKNHIGLYPGGEATTFFADKLAGYKTSKGAIQLPNKDPLPVELITEIATWCGVHNG